MIEFAVHPCFIHLKYKRKLKLHEKATKFCWRYGETVFSDIL